MTFRELEYLCALIEEGSITKAAKKLVIAQPALSRQINTIEQEYSIEILDRRNKPATITETGYVFYDTAKQILSLRDQLENELLNANRQKVFIKTIEIFSYNLLPSVFSLMREKYPNADFRIYESTSRELFLGHYYQNIDFYIHTFDATANTEEINLHDTKYTHEAIGYEEILLATHKSNPLCAKLGCAEEIDLRELKDEQFIVTSTSSLLEHIGRKMCLELGGFEPIFIEGQPTYTRVLSFLQYNTCWAFIPDTAKKYYNVHPDILFFKIKNNSFKRSIVASYPKDRKMSKIAKECIGIIKKTLNCTETVSNQN